MQSKDSKNINEKFDGSIDEMLDSIKVLDPESEATKMSEQVRNLDAIIKAKNEFNRPAREFAEMAARVGGTVLSIGILLAFEQSHVITSKALSFIPKPRL